MFTSCSMSFGSAVLVLLHLSQLLLLCSVTLLYKHNGCNCGVGSTSSLVCSLPTPRSVHVVDGEYHLVCSLPTPRLWFSFAVLVKLHSRLSGLNRLWASTPNRIANTSVHLSITLQTLINHISLFFNPISQPSFQCISHHIPRSFTTSQLHLHTDGRIHPLLSLKTINSTLELI